MFSLYRAMHDPSSPTMVFSDDLSYPDPACPPESNDAKTERGMQVRKPGENGKREETVETKGNEGRGWRARRLKK